jgi:hypothetical protein
VPQISYFRIEPTFNLTPVEPPTASQVWADGEPHYLMLVKPSGAGDLAGWARATDFYRAMPPDMLDPDEDSALVQRRAGSVYLQYPTNWDGATRSKGYLSLLCLPHRLIALPNAAVVNLDKMIADACSPGMLRSADVAGLVAYLISSYAKSLEVTLRLLRNDLAEVEARVDADLSARGAVSGKGSALAQMQALWPQMAALLDLVDDQAFALRTLRELSSPALDLDAHRDYLDDLAADSDHAYRVAVRLETRYRLLGERLESIQASATERRLRALTIISAVFLPLTLVTGYFGMNFADMPLLGVPNATVILVILMLALTAALLVYFKRANWM